MRFSVVNLGRPFLGQNTGLEQLAEKLRNMERYLNDSCTGPNPGHDCDQVRQKYESLLGAYNELQQRQSANFNPSSEPTNAYVPPSMTTEQAYQSYEMVRMKPNKLVPSSLMNELKVSTDLGPLDLQSGGGLPTPTPTPSSPPSRPAVATPGSPPRPGVSTIDDLMKELKVSTDLGPLELPLPSKPGAMLPPRQDVPSIDCSHLGPNAYYDGRQCRSSDMTAAAGGLINTAFGGGGTSMPGTVAAPSFMGLGRRSFPVINL